MATTWSVPPAGSPLIDSADANAPGVTAQDLQGNPRFADDPSVPNTGTGAGTLDRGAQERQSRLTVLPSYTPAGTTCAAPCDVSVDPTPQDSWNEPVTTEVDFGDGSPAQPVTDGSAAHQYTVPGPVHRHHHRHQRRRPTGERHPAGDRGRRPSRRP